MAEFRRPEWLKEGLVVAGEWEPLIYRRRGGFAGTDAYQRHLLEHSEQAADALADLGVNLVITHYHKGFGPAAEADEYDLLRQFIRLCHERAIRVSVYMRLDTLVSETLLLEKPEAKQWFQVNWNGQHPVYNDGDSGPLYYRNQACPCNCGYLSWIEERVRFAIQDLGVDMIHFDGVMPFLEGYQCYCDLCVGEFRAYLQWKYADPALAKERFGFANLSQISPPTYAEHPTMRTSPRYVRVVKDPVMQEWTWWRVEKLVEVHHRLSRLIRGLNPEVAFDVNTLMPIESNHYFWSAVDFPRIAEENDCLWTEDSHAPRLTEDGILISRIREFKIGRTLKNIILSYQWGGNPAELKLCLAQAMAFNAQTIGMVSGVTAARLGRDEEGWPGRKQLPGQPLAEWPSAYEIKKQHIRFFRDHFEHYANTESVGGIALLRSRHALAQSMTAPQHHALLWEQVLIQSGLPFDIIFDEQLADLSKHQVLVLPNADCMSEEVMAAVRQYVEGGGGLVATGETATHDPWRRKRPEMGLRDVLGPQASLSGDPHHGTRHQYGEGRAAYLPAILTEADLADGAAEAAPNRRASRLQLDVTWFAPSYWKLPLNARAMRQAVEWASRGRLPIWLEGPETVVAEFLTHPLRQAQACSEPSRRGGPRLGGYLVHLVNFDLTRTRHDLEVKLRLPRGVRVRSVIALDPESARPEKLRGAREGAVTAILVPRLEIYKLLVISTAGRAAQAAQRA